MRKGLLILLITVFSAAVAPETVYLPIVIQSPPKKCFAWAGGAEMPEQATVAGARCYHNWTIEPSRVPGMAAMAVFWDRERFGADLMQRLRALETGDTDGFMIWRSRPIVLFLNEPDLPSQSALPPDEAATLYLAARAACPSCTLFGPGVSAWDAHCDWPPHEATSWQAEILHWGQWCYWQQFWHEVEQIDRVAVIEGRQYASVHHYDSVAWHEPKRGVLPLQPIEELEKLGARHFVISEYGSCEPQMMRQMVAAYEADGRIVAHFVWAPQLRPVNGWPPCEVLFDYGTINLTAVGRAWRDG